jgi:hypothetical protein
MNESIRIRFEMDGEPLSVDMLDETGVRFENEADAWPRTLVVEFDADNEITRTRMHWVRERMGWNPGLFNLRLTRDGGELVLSGTDARAFPGGVYWLVLQVNSLRIKGGVHRVVVDEDSEATLTLEVTEDPRRVVLRTPIDEWDDLIRATLTRQGQTFDGLPLADWMASAGPRESRKACLLNLMAKLRVLPDEDEPFLNHVRRIFLSDVERIYVETDRRLLLRLRALAARQERPFYDEGPPASPDHLRLLSRAAVPNDRLQSFRQDGRNSMQVVVAYPDGTAANGQYFADVDIDLGNPLRDLEGFVIHMGELLSGSDTDHLKLHDELVKAKQPTAPFIYYDVRRS